jgi:hypothetical protein
MPKLARLAEARGGADPQLTLHSNLRVCPRALCSSVPSHCLQFAVTLNLQRPTDRVKSSCSACRGWRGICTGRARLASIGTRRHARVPSGKGHPIAVAGWPLAVAKAKRALAAPKVS